MLQLNQTIASNSPQADEAKLFARHLRDIVAETPTNQPIRGIDRIHGTDRSDTVTCVVDALGVFVDLSIKSDWWYTLGPDQIASAVLDALGLAQAKATLATAILRHYGRADALPTTPRNPLIRDDLLPKSSPDTYAEYSTAKVRIERTFAIIGATDRLIRLRDSTDPRIVTGPANVFRLFMVGFAVKYAEVNRSSISPSDTQRITEDARAALLQATREQDPAHWFSGEGVR